MQKKKLKREIIKLTKGKTRIRENKEKKSVGIKSIMIIDHNKEMIFLDNGRGPTNISSIRNIYTIFDNCSICC